jgi:predicted nucleic acid-binding protein
MNSVDPTKLTLFSPSKIDSIPEKIDWLLFDSDVIIDLYRNSLLTDFLKELSYAKNSSNIGVSSCVIKPVKHEVLSTKQKSQRAELSLFLKEEFEELNINDKKIFEIASKVQSLSFDSNSTTSPVDLYNAATLARYNQGERIALMTRNIKDYSYPLFIPIFSFVISAYGKSGRDGGALGNSTMQIVKVNPEYIDKILKE